MTTYREQFEARLKALQRDSETYRAELRAERLELQAEREEREQARIDALKLEMFQGGRDHAAECQRQ